MSRCAAISARENSRPIAASWAFPRLAEPIETGLRRRLELAGTDLVVGASNAAFAISWTNSGTPSRRGRRFRRRKLGRHSTARPPRDRSSRWPPPPTTGERERDVRMPRQHELRPERDDEHRPEAGQASHRRPEFQARRITSGAHLQNQQQRSACADASAPRGRPALAGSAADVAPASAGCAVSAAAQLGQQGRRRRIAFELADHRMETTLAVLGRQKYTAGGAGRQRPAGKVRRPAETLRCRARRRQDQIGPPRGCGSSSHRPTFPLLIGGPPTRSSHRHARLPKRRRCSRERWRNQAPTIRRSFGSLRPGSSISNRLPTRRRSTRQSCHPCPAADHEARGEVGRLADHARS